MRRVQGSLGRGTGSDGGMKVLEDFLKPTQSQLFQQLAKMYQGKTVSAKGKFLLVKGEASIMLVAHLDTVHREPVRTICTSQKG